MIFRKTVSTKWTAAQKFEFRHAKKFMDAMDTESLLKRINSPDFRVSSGYTDPSIVEEFFGGSIADWEQFVRHITDRTVLEVGPCIAPQIAGWDVAKSRLAIEPLYEKISSEQQRRFGVDGYPNVKVFSIGAEICIDQLVGKVDGAVLIRNCLDHSPNWPFILANLSLYSTKGAQLLLSNDLSHPKHLRRGHFEISEETNQFRNLVIALGWEILFEFQDPDSLCTNWGCRAVRT